nr:B3 domain-containing transcription factor VRN1-like [Malus domestica]
MVVGWEKEPLGSRVVADRALAVGPCAVGSKCKPDLWGTSAEWEIELRRCNGEVWFEKGWPEFSKFYSLDYAFWLVFGYEGNSRFHVFIFDRSCTEVDYPIKLPEKEKTDYEDDESVEILDDFPTSRRRKGERYSSLPCPLPPKKKRKSYPRMHPLTEKDKAIALQRAIAFKSEKPHFKVAMQPSYIFGNLILPAGFAKRHLMHQPDGNAILRLPDGGTWALNLHLKLSFTGVQKLQTAPCLQVYM